MTGIGTILVIMLLAAAYAAGIFDDRFLPK